MSHSIEETIQDSPLFKHLDATWKTRLVDTAERLDLEKGQSVIQEGTQAKSLYIVMRGKVRVSTTAEDREVELKTLGIGAYFGEVSLLSGKKATATVEAKNDRVQLVVLDRPTLLELVAEDDKVRKMLEGVTLARAKDTIGKVLK